MSTTLRAALLTATGRLREAGVPHPDRDAAELALHVLTLAEPTELAHAEELRPEDAAALDRLVARRAAREPLPHLTGRVTVRDIDLAVGPGVFVPQPETEAVIAWAIDAVAATRNPRPLVADLCTGSGTIAFCLANEIPGVTVHAVERDPGAMRWAQRNAALRVVAGDPVVMLHLGDVEGCLPELDGQLDLVASNPPYVATHETHVPDPEVVDHDPQIALWAGEDGLDLVRAVEQAARRLLRPDGLVVVEHSDRQGRTAPAVFTDAGGWTEVTDHVDQFGRDRFVTARWTGTRS